MSNLYAFLHPEVPENKEVVFSRFKDEDGKVVPFIIRPITAEENKELVKKYTIVTKDRRGSKRHLDSDKYQTAVVIAGTVKPEFDSAELCEAYGVLDPQDLVGKMLFAGEFATLAEEIFRLSGLDDESVEDEAEEAKN